MTQHIIPVPRDMTPEDAWAEIQHFGKLHGYRRWRKRFWRMRWAVIEVEDPPYDQEADEWGECD